MQIDIEDFISYLKEYTDLFCPITNKAVPVSHEEFLVMALEEYNYNKPVIEFVKQNHPFARTYTSTLANGTKRLKFFFSAKDYEYSSSCDLMEKIEELKKEIEKNFPEWKVAEPKSNNLNLYRG